jgi:hypothetical protein
MHILNNAMREACGYMCMAGFIAPAHPSPFIIFYNIFLLYTFSLLLYVLNIFKYNINRVSARALFIAPRSLRIILK